MKTQCLYKLAESGDPFYPTEETYMADLPPESDVGPDHGSTTGMPRWVKVSAIAAIAAVVVVLLVVAVLLISGGEHGPGRHMRSGDVGGGTPSAMADLVPLGAGHR